MTDPTETDRPGLPVKQAAAAMNTPVGTFRRWMRIKGFPMVHAGRRGRGHAALVDPEEVRQWRERVAAAPAGGADAGMQQLGADLPEQMAAAFAEAFQQIEGPHKRALAGALARCWYVATCSVLDTLRVKCPDVPQVNKVPAVIQQLQKIESS